MTWSLALDVLVCGGALVFTWYAFGMNVMIDEWRDEKRMEECLREDNLRWQRQIRLAELT